jgi:hypothetical protein
MNDCTRTAKMLMPDSVNMIAPYNIKAEKSDDFFVKQLERMNIDIIAYQDGVGVNSTRLGEPAKYFENLYKAHTKSITGKDLGRYGIILFRGRYQRKSFTSRL